MFVPYSPEGLHNVEFLSLGDFWEEKMYPSINIDLPNFENLVELWLFPKNSDSLFKELPAKCPKLQVLQVNIMDDHRNCINQRCRYHIAGGVRKHNLSVVPFLPKTIILGKCLSKKTNSLRDIIKLFFVMFPLNYYAWFWIWYVNYLIKIQS